MVDLGQYKITQSLTYHFNLVKIVVKYLKTIQIFVK